MNRTSGFTTNNGRFGCSRRPEEYVVNQTASGLGVVLRPTPSMYACGKSGPSQRHARELELLEGTVASFSLADLRCQRNLDLPRTVELEPIRRRFTADESTK